MIKFLQAKLKPLLLSLNDPAIFALYGDISSEENKERIATRILSGNIGSFYEQNSPALDQPAPLSALAEAPPEAPGAEGKVRDEGKLKEILRDIFRREKKDFQN